MFWKKKSKKAETEKNVLREPEVIREEVAAELERRVEFYISLCHFYKEACEKWQALYDERIEEAKKKIAYLKGDRETIRCAKHEAERALEAAKQRCRVAITALSNVWQEAKKFGMHEEYEELAKSVEELLEERKEG